MRKIGHIETQQDAERFHNYLLSLEIENQSDQSDDRWEVWVIDEDQIEQAVDEFEQFQSDPSLEKYNVAPPKTVQPTITTPRPRQRRTVSAAGESLLLTKVLIIISVWVAIATDFGSKNLELVGQLYITNIVGDSLPEIMNGQVWRLYTPLFLHFSLMHLLFNGYAMWLLGGTIERKRGTTYLLLLVATISPVSHLTQFIGFGAAFGGLSGMIYGLFGFIWMRARFVPEDEFRMPSFIVIQLAIWLALGLSGTLGPVANGAHLGGLIAGMLMGFWPALSRR